MNTTPTIITPEATQSFDFGGLGVQWKINGSAAAVRVTVVHLLLALRALSSPLRFHHCRETH
ncbi:MAG: hypothetical protein SNJ52_00150 [Verrucomicrobiia bacterium]